MKIVQELLKKTIDGSAGNLTDITIEYASFAGQQFNQGGSERENRLVIQGDGHVCLFRRRSGGDIAIDPPGEFEDELTKDELYSLIQNIADTDFSIVGNQPPSPGHSVQELIVSIGNIIEKVVFSVSSPEDAINLSGVRNSLNTLLNRTFSRTLWTLQCELINIKQAENNCAVTIRFANFGKTPILLINPLSPEPVKPVLSLRFGEKPVIVEGETPLPIMVTTSLSISDSLETVRFNSLSEGESIELPAIFPADGLVYGNSIIQVSYYFYGLRDQLFNRRLFRGALFSKEYLI